MDEGRKRTLAVVAAVLAAPRLVFLDEKSPNALREVMADGVRKAEILLAQIDHRWPANRVPGKN
jgi:hypothetical protein